MLQIPSAPDAGSVSPARLNRFRHPGGHDLRDETALAVLDQWPAERDYRRGADDLVDGRR